MGRVRQKRLRSSLAERHGLTSGILTLAWGKAPRNRRGVVIRGRTAEGRMAATTQTSFPVIREAVASFPDRAHFRRAVSALLAAGFAPSELSVLASHQPLAAAEEKPG